MSVSSCDNSTHSWNFYIYTLYITTRKKTTATTDPIVEALYPKKTQPHSRKGLLETLYDEVEKEYFQEIMKEARRECVIKVGSKKNSKTGKISDEWCISALNQVGKGRTFAWAVLSLYGALANAKVKEGGVYEYE